MIRSKIYTDFFPIKIDPKVQSQLNLLGNSNACIQCQMTWESH